MLKSLQRSEDEVLYCKFALLKAMRNSILRSEQSFLSHTELFTIHKYVIENVGL